jgi:hypothetical protein
MYVWVVGVRIVMGPGGVKEASEAEAHALKTGEIRGRMRRDGEGRKG